MISCLVSTFWGLALAALLLMIASPRGAARGFDGAPIPVRAGDGRRAALEGRP
ncbi:MAG: hypothetical protein AAFP13_00780 [Pseudomonadota bacterium]